VRTTPRTPIGVPFVFGAGDSGGPRSWPRLIARHRRRRDVAGCAMQRARWSETSGAEVRRLQRVHRKARVAARFRLRNRTSNDIAAFADPNPGLGYTAISRNRRVAHLRRHERGGADRRRCDRTGGNGSSTLLDAAYLYAHAAALNAVTSAQRSLRHVPVTAGAVTARRPQRLAQRHRRPVALFRR